MVIEFNKQKKLAKKRFKRKLKKLYIQYQKLAKNNTINTFERLKDWKKIKRYLNKRKRKFIRKEKKRKKSKYKETKARNDVLEIPENLDFLTTADSIELLLERIKEYLRIKNHNIRIDLSKMNNITINGLIFLISEIDKLISKKKPKKLKKIKFNYNKKYGINTNNEKLKFLLYKIGYWQYFSMKKPYKILKETENDYFLSIRSNTTASVECVYHLRTFIIKQVNFIKNIDIQECFDDAITEAIANSVEHGYIEKTDFRTKGKWWLCGHYDKHDDYLEFSFRDYGVGLRKTLEYNANDKISSLIRDVNNIRKKDSDIIKMLVNDKLPKYEDNGQVRGYGFKKFKEFVKNIGYECDMKVISGNGKYNYIYNPISNERKETLTDLNFKIDGFLISWKIYLRGNKNV